MSSAEDKDLMKRHGSSSDSLNPSDRMNAIAETRYLNRRGRSVYVLDELTAVCVVQKSSIEARMLTNENGILACILFMKKNCCDVELIHFQSHRGSEGE